jgi:hypothetical protein
MCLSRSLPFLLPLSVCLSLSLDLSLCVCPSLTLSLSVLDHLISQEGITAVVLKIGKMRMAMRRPTASTPGALEATGDLVTPQLPMSISRERSCSSLRLKGDHNSLKNRSSPIALSLCGLTSLQIRDLYCGSTYSLFISKSGHVYFNGILPNSPRKEACTYPRAQEELYNWNTNRLSGGSSWILIGADGSAVYWGVPVAGSFGLENDVKRSAVPAMVSAVSEMRLLDISSGYAHSCIVVSSVVGATESETETNRNTFETKISQFPSLAVEEPPQETSSGAKGKKRGAAAAAAPTKRGKKK